MGSSTLISSTLLLWWRLQEQCGYRDLECRARLAPRAGEWFHVNWCRHFLSPSSNPAEQQRIPGGQKVSIEAVVWRDGFIFTAGLTSQISQWRADTLELAGTVDSFGGAVWALGVSPNGDTLAAGCEDGCIKLFDITPNGLVYSRSFDRQEGRLLSVHWGADSNVMVSGGSAGVLHIWNVALGRCRLAIRATEINAAETLVWCARLLPVRMVDEQGIMAGSFHRSC